MKPRKLPPPTRDSIRLLTVATDGGSIDEAPLSSLTNNLDPGDVLVVNDAATLPASIRLSTKTGLPLELRLVELTGTPLGNRARAIAFGAGDWRTDTEDRPPPPSLGKLDRLFHQAQPVATVSSTRGRLVDLVFDTPRPLDLIYEIGRPVQYSHVGADLELWSVQTSFASRPVAFEMPSAGRGLSWSILLALRRRGVVLARITHAAGLSSSGDPSLDKRFPLDEWYEVPAETASAIKRAKRTSNRVVAVGTTVVRALESAAQSKSTVEATTGIATMKISRSTKLAVVDAIVTGMHEQASSHFELLGAFAPPDLLRQAWAVANNAGFRSHELGDVALIGPSSVGPSSVRRQMIGAAPSRPKSSSTAIAAAMVR